MIIFFSKLFKKYIFNKAKLKNLKLIMTEKDFFKLNEFKLENINYLKVSLSINNEEKLIERYKKKQIY